MKYYINDNIRVRICDSQTFFVNIHNNSIFNINTNTYMYLKNRLDEGLNTTTHSESKEFINFIMELKKNGILGEFL